MKLTLQIQLFPDKEQANLLRLAMERFNEAANWLAGFAFERKTANKLILQKLYYAELRERFELPAQYAIRCIAQVCEAFKRDKSKRPKFRKDASMPLDHHLMGFKGVDRVSIRTLDARVIVPFVMGKYQHERFAFAKGQCDLVRRKDGKWFLLVTAVLPDGTPVPTTDFIGVDLGVVNIATTDEGERSSGESIEKVRTKYHERRKKLQKVAAIKKRRGQRPKQIRKALKRMHKKEARFRADKNHCISKKLVAMAKDTGKGIALENLKGIRSRQQFRKRQRAKMNGWAFFQLRAFIEYKARLSGVRVELIDPRNTSRECSECHHIEKANRKSQSEFLCKRCGFMLNADTNGARNIRAKAIVMLLSGLGTTDSRLVQGQAAGF